MYIIVGLGNPGIKYANTRHNVGFMTIESLAKKYNIDVNKKKSQALVGEGIIEGEKVVLAMPQTFMNLSGEAVVGLMHWYKIDTDRLIVVYDDIDIETGKLRIREKGSGGSHNGMKNIIELLGKNDFSRMRIGIGEKPERMDLADYVLSQIRGEDKTLIGEAITEAVEAIEVTIKENISKAMNLYNS